MPRRILYAILAVLFIWAAGVEIRTAVYLLRPQQVRYPFQLDPYSDRVVNPRPEAAFAGVLERDRILAVEGVPLTGLKVYSRPLQRLHPGDRLVLTVAPDEGTPATKQVSIVLHDAPAVRAGEFVLLLVTPSACLLLGFFVVGIRPRDLRAWLLLGMMAGFASLSSPDMYGWQDGIRQSALAFHELFVVLWAAFMMLFGIYFPERIGFDIRRPWMKWLLLAPLLFLGFAQALDALGASENFHALAAFHRVVQPLGKLQALLMMAGISSFFTLMGMRRGMEQSPDARRRLRLLAVGGEVGLMPAGVVFMSRVFFGSIIEQKWPWIAIPSFLLMFAFPATLAYVIVVHRALDVRVALRQGLQYTLVRGGVRGLQGGLIIVAATLAAQGQVSPLQRFVFVAFAIIAVVRLRQIGEKVKGWVDRRFFREAVDTEQVLGELGENVRGIVEASALLEVVVRRLSESLHVPRVAVLLAGGEGYCAEFSLGMDAAIPCLPLNGAIAHKLIDGGAARVYFDDPQSWVQAAGAEQAPLRALDTQLLLPLRVKDRLPGIISLGPKQSEEPYSASDLRLLESVATQTGLALENARLTAAMADEIAQRERLNREMEIAREVQERLFPQNTPAVPGLDYCGHCRPALGVGGDYYDFIPQPAGRLGIAIGDVSGKGIAAALLMASLQASLRGQTLGVREDLATLMRRINTLVYDASSSNRYATFFYAEYDPATRRMAYVNAGHNPPVIVRGSETIRLEANGAVVGLLRDGLYGEGEVELQDGDLFVAFTDGISEAMNPEDEEWGEDAMIEESHACLTAKLSARQTLDRLFQASDAFARGAKQHDDMTLVVGRVYCNA